MPEEVFETPQPTQPTESKITNWPRIIAAAILGLGLLVGVAYAGYWYGTESAKLTSKTQEIPAPTPAPSTVPTVEQIYENTVYGYSIRLPSGWRMENSDNSSSYNARIITDSGYPGVLVIPPSNSSYPARQQGESLLQWVNRISPYKNKIVRDLSQSDRAAALLMYDNMTIAGGGFDPDKPGGDYVHKLFIKVEGIGVFELYSEGKMDDVYYDIDFLDWIERVTHSGSSPTGGETEDWKTYADNIYNFSLKYPSPWQISKGNEHAPSIPASMAEIINLQSDVGVIDVSIIPWHNNLKKDLSEELSSFISGFLGDLDVSYEKTQLDGHSALKGSYFQSATGSQTKVILTAVERGDYVIFLQTQFDVEDTHRLSLYNQILSTFKFLD